MALVSALALLVKRVRPPNAPLAVATKFCVVLVFALFVTPTPLMVKMRAGLVTMPKEVDDPGLKTTPFTSVLAETETEVRSDALKVAVSAAPLGTVPASNSRRYSNRCWRETGSTCRRRPGCFERRAAGSPPTSFR